MRSPLIEQTRAHQCDRLSVQRFEQGIELISSSRWHVRHLLNLCSFAVSFCQIVSRLRDWNIIDDVADMRILAYQEANNQQKLYLRIKVLLFFLF